MFKIPLGGTVKVYQTSSRDAKNPQVGSGNAPEAVEEVFVPKVCPAQAVPISTGRAVDIAQLSLAGGGGGGAIKNSSKHQERSAFDPLKS